MRNILSRILYSVPFNFYVDLMGQIPYAFFPIVNADQRLNEPHYVSMGLAHAISGVRT